MPGFIHGLELSELFFKEIVRPMLAQHFSAVSYSAALLGSGSEVLGFDTPMSADHHWGPRLLVFLSADDYATHQANITESLREQLPYRFRGYATNFGPPDEFGTRLMNDIEAGPVNHRVELKTVTTFFEDYLGVNPYDDVQPLDWLTLPEQRLLAVTSGKVFHDGLDELHLIRQKFAYYPRDVWLYLLAAQWTWLSEEEAFVGRTGYVGDELGSQIIATRLVRALMKLCFLMERRYAPYSKWFGTAFARLSCAPRLTSVFQRVLAAQDWREREKHLSAAYTIAAAMHNALGVTAPLDTNVSPFWGRPFHVIHGERFANAIKQSIADAAIKAIPIDIGAVDQFVDCTDVQSNPNLYRRLRVMFE